MFPALSNHNLISIGQLCDHGFTVAFTAKEVSLTGPNTTLPGTRNIDNGLYYIDLQHLNLAPNTHLTQHYPCSNNVHTLSTKSNIMQYIHRAAFIPVVSSWTTAITAGFFTTWPGFTSALVRKHLPKSIANTKGHLRQDQQSVRSTMNNSPSITVSNLPVMTTPILPSQEDTVQTQMAYLQAIDFTGKVSTDQTWRFPVTSSRGSKYLMVLYDHDSNAILAEPLTSRNERELIRATRVLHAYISVRGLTPSTKCWKMSAPAASKRFYARQVSSFNSCPHNFIAPTPQNEQSKLTRITSSPA